MNAPWIELPDGFASDPQKKAVRDAIYACELVAAAIATFDFFSCLSKSPADAHTICASMGLTERVTDVMLTLFSAMGLVEKQQDTFHVTESAPQILDSLSPWYRDQAAFAERPVHGVIREVLRTGEPAVWAKGEKPWAEMIENELFARRFLKTMDAHGAYLAPSLAACLDFSNHSRLLDIAGGSGIYSCHIVQKHPTMKATVVEKSPVDRVTLEYIAERGCLGFVDVTTANIFSESLPTGYDVHLWSNALHDWDTATVKQLIEKSYTALPPGGIIVIHDSHINRQKTGPLAVANYSVFLVVSTNGKCYSLAEIEGLLGETGFQDATCRDTVFNHSIVTALK
jgi:hypothetical protein